MDTPDILQIKPAHVAQAAEQLKEVEARCNAVGALSVSQVHVEQASRKLNDLQDEQQSAQHACRLTSLLIYHRLVNWVDRVVLRRFGVSAFLVLVALATFLLASSCLIPFLSLTVGLLASAFMAFLITCAAALALVFLWPSDERLTVYRNLQTEWLRAKKNYDHLENLISHASAHYRALSSALVIRQEYDFVRANYDQLRQIFESKKFQLLHTEWRLLEGVPFENFLKEVFESLAYHVETTKASGDQGLDLIVIGRGRRIGVQAKRYKGSVGNGAVQEAHAGMKFYDCDSCVVITTGHFTRGARQLAEKIDCGLIEEKQIPDLILGRIY